MSSKEQPPSSIRAMTHHSNEAITQPLRFWDDKFWHHLVHQRLGETLFYYLVRIRPSNLSEIEACLKRIMEDDKLGSVRVFPIFGTYDIIIRAWLYPSVADRFRNDLEVSLATAGASRVVHTFRVEHVDQRWHGKENVDKEMLESLEESTIRDVQLGKNPGKFAQLVAGNLAFQRRKTESIRFFVAINVDFLDGELPLGIVNAIKHDLSTTPNIKNVSIYRGIGFCQILVKGEVLDYFSIAPLPNWIGAAYHRHGAQTETYLVHGPSPTLGDESVGDATFFALRGRDLFVQSVIPELYDHPFEKRHDVERLLIDFVHAYVPGAKDKDLLHDYLFAYLTDDGSGMAKTLLIFFHDLESYMAKHHKEFIARISSKSPREMFQAAHLDDEAFNRPSLRQMFMVCALSMKTKEPSTQNDNLTKSWDDLGDLRNDIIHGRADHLKDWDVLLRRLVPQLARIREFLNKMVETTHISPIGDYF